jgi:GTP-binding protein
MKKYHESIIRLLTILTCIKSQTAFTINNVLPQQQHHHHHTIFPTTLKLSPESSSSSPSESSSQDDTFYSPNAELEIKSETAETDTLTPQEMEEAMGLNEYSFFDEAQIFVRAGSGGQGASTYKKGPGGQNAQPDGGDGGKGGEVSLLVDECLNTLAGLTQAWRPNSFGGGGGAKAASGGLKMRPMSFRAENGHDGARKFKSGRFGKDVVIRVPPGTLVQEEVDVVEIDEETGEEKVIRIDLIDLGTVGKDDWNSEMVVSLGGEGGEGSGSQGYKKGRGVRRTRASPVGGERKRLKLTLKIVADVALVGVPNAGKSTFLAAVTRAKPKIANYPFTTVIPNLGVWIPPNAYGNDDDVNNKSSGSGSEGLALCDVPGLIAGAAEGVGLGHAFLRHVERCHVILHLVDATSNDPVADYKMVNKEILSYGNGKLAQMPQIAVVNKVDAWEEGSGEDWEHGLKTRMDRESLEQALKEAMPHSRLMWMSAKARERVDDLKGRMSVFVKKVKEAKESSY